MSCKDRERRKAYRKAYRQRPEVKVQRRERKRARRQRLEVKAWEAEYARKYRQRPETRAREKIRNRRRKSASKGINQEYLRQYLASHPCRDCGEVCIFVLDFHHRNPSSRDVGVPRLAREGVSLQRLEKEIAKCDVLCKNCHAKCHGKKGYDDTKARESNTKSWRRG